MLVTKIRRWKIAGTPNKTHNTTGDERRIMPCKDHYDELFGRRGGLMVSALDSGSSDPG